MTREDIEKLIKAEALLRSILSNADMTVDPEGMTMAEAIKRQRQLMGLSLQEVADSVGSSKSYLWDLEQGRHPRPSASIVWRLSKSLGLDCAWLCEAAERQAQRLAEAA